MKSRAFGLSACSLACCFLLADGNCQWSAAQEPEGAARPFVPSAGYLQTTKRLYFQRRARDQRAGIALAPGQPLELRGSRSLPVICVEFSNVAKPFETAAYQTALFGAEGPTMTRYYRDMSQGKLTVTGKVLGWYALPNMDEHYEGANNGLGGAGFKELLTGGLEKADADVDFGEFDNDGPDGVPNSGDDDGVVDTVFFVHPEQGAECFPLGESKNIWSHSWHYDDPTIDGDKPFETKDIAKNEQGEPRLAADGSEIHILVDDYTIQPGLSCKTTASEKKIGEIGVFCHEYGHALGLPDLYDRTPSSGADSEGVGNWCLMAAGSHGGDGSNPQLPAHMGAWCKYYLGWSNVELLEAGDGHVFEPVAAANKMYRFNVPGTNNLEFFLIELRTKTPGAAGGVNWDEHLPAAGLAVWHIDERVGGHVNGLVNENWPFCAHNQGQNDSPTRILAATPSFAPKHQLVRLIQPDRQMHLEKKFNRADAGDVFTAGEFGDDQTLIAGSRGYDGKPTNLKIAAISIATDHALANVTVPAASGGPMASPPQDVVRAPAPEAARARTFVRNNGARVLSGGLQAVPAAERDQLQATPSRVIREVADKPAEASALIRASAEARTQKINMQSATDSPMESRVQNIIEGNMMEKEATVRFKPEQRGVERITGLSLSTQGRTPGEDAQARLAGDWRGLFGEGANLRPVDAATRPTAAQQRFQQYHKIGNEELPIFGRQVTLRYADDRLTATTANLINEALEFPQQAGNVTAAEATEEAAKKLGVEPDVFKDAVKGIYLVNDDPKQAHVAYRLTMASGPKGRVLQVYVDSRSKAVLAVK